MTNTITMRHTDHEFDDELDRMRLLVGRMGELVETMLVDAMKAFLSNDASAATAVMDAENEVDLLEVETDELCLKVLARRQPMGADLRLVRTALKIVTDLERVGDLCTSITKRAVEQNAPCSEELREALVALSEEVRSVLHNVLQSFATNDAKLARMVISADQGVDARYSEAVRKIMVQMTQNLDGIYETTRIHTVAKYLERIGDHATNLAEMVVFLVEGKDIRHPSAVRRDT